MENCKHSFVVQRQGGALSRLLFLCALCLLGAATAVAQQGRDPFSTSDGSRSQGQTYETRGAVLQVTVESKGKGPLDRQSVAKLRNTLTGNTVWQTTTDRGETAFGDLEVATYDLEVSAVGYLTAHKEVKVLGPLASYHVEIVLERDPASIDISATGASQLPKKTRKVIQHGVSALKSGDYKQAERELEAARKLAPDDADVNFLLGYLAFQQKRVDVAKDYLRRASRLDPRNTQAPILLGRISLQQEEYGKAQAALEQAVAASPQDWLAHNLLAESYLKQHEFEKAREQAQAAIEINKLASSSSQLVLGEALANLGRTQEAIEALKMFLQQEPDSPAAAQVRDFIGELGRAPAAPAGNSTVAVKGLAPVAGANPRVAPSAEPQFAAIGWEPPGIDELKPVVAAGVACPTEAVVEQTGLRVKQLADDVARIAAIEDLLHEKLDASGSPTTKETRKFNYVASIEEPAPGFLEVNEFRSERSGLDDLPDHISSNGFMSLAFIFHPAMRDNFQMSCEGLGDWHGQATWLIRFKQRDDRPNHFHNYVVNGTSYPVGLKGRAWIKTDKFQIVRMESELVSPAPAIRLATEHQIVEYGPVPFEKKNEELWLPRSAELYFNFRNRRYFRRHSLDHFMLFSVDAAEKRDEPKQSLQTSPPPPAPAPTTN